MDQEPRELPLGGEVLGTNRHICALFDGPEAASRVVVPFVLGALRREERVVYLTGDRNAFRERLGGNGQVAAAIGSGQLEIRPWTESYLSGGGFSASRMLAQVRRTLREGLRQGYRATRFIGEMQWAQEGVAGVDQLMPYESGVGAILGRSRDTLLCVYDLRRHTAARIAEVLAVHRTAFADGHFQPTKRAPRRTSPRERILSAASLLFAEVGIRAAGVDTLIDAAGVAKATFYRHFPAKDDLIVAWLEDPRTRWLESVRTQVEARATSPQDLVPLFFAVVGEWLEAGDFRGCPYLNTAIELANPDHPAEPVIRSYLRDVERYIEQILSAAGYRDAASLATELQTMTAGAVILGVAHRTGSFVTAARDAATRLLATAARKAPVALS
jgi:AcrR family transcriptional regulator